MPVLSGSAVMVILATAFLLFVFGFIAQQVAEGKQLKFDRHVILALRNSTDPTVPIGPGWLQEAARDITSLGSIVVLGIITFAVVGYLFLSHKPAVAWSILIAVLGGVALNNLLKFATRRRPRNGRQNAGHEPILGRPAGEFAGQAPPCSWQENWSRNAGTDRASSSQH